MVAGALLGLGSANPAWAHAVLLGTDPPDGAVLPAAPEAVTLTFNEPVEVRPGAVRLLNAAGDDLGASSRVVDTRVVISVPPAADADGSYIVNWRIVSADSHPVAGAFTFSVGAPSAGVEVSAAPRADPGVQVIRQVTEGLGYAGVLGSVGLAVFGLVLLPATTGGGTVVRRRIRGITRTLAALAYAAMIATIPVTIAWQNGDGPGALLDADTWRSGLSSETTLMAVLVMAGLAAMMVATRPGRGDHRRAQVVIAFAGAGLAVSALALVGHTRTMGPAALVLPADLLHVATAAVWFGGLIGLGVTFARTSDVTPTAAAAAVAGFSRMAAVLVALVGLAGVLMAWRILKSWSALFGTGYGLALIAKVAAVLVVLAIAGWNRYRLVPAIAAQPEPAATAWPTLRRTVRTEALLLVAVVATTGVLVTQSPVISEATPSEQDTALTADLGSGQATVQLTPRRVGVNSLELTIVDANRRPVEPLTPPELRITLPAGEIGPLDRQLSQTGPGRYESITEFPLPGDWIIEISVRTSKYENPIARIPVTIQ